MNQPEDGVYNGDIGEIIQIFTARETEDKQEQILIAFEENEVLYSRANYLNFMHAYCISIHKSQGSEFQSLLCLSLDHIGECYGKTYSIQLLHEVNSH